MKKILLIMILLCVNIFGADTLESYSKDGFGVATFQDFTNDSYLMNYSFVGYGITDKISPYVSSFSIQDKDLTISDNILSVGIFSNIINHNTLKLDLLMEYNEVKQAMVGFELNLDFNIFGFYSRMKQLDIFDSLDIQNVIGGYVTFGRFQFLCEISNFTDLYDFGLNILIHDNVEIISHIGTDNTRSFIVGGTGLFIFF